MIFILKYYDINSNYWFIFLNIIMKLTVIIDLDS